MYSIPLNCPIKYVFHSRYITYFASIYCSYIKLYAHKYMHICAQMCIYIGIASYIWLYLWSFKKVHVPLFGCICCSTCYKGMKHCHWLKITWIFIHDNLLSLNISQWVIPASIRVTPCCDKLPHSLIPYIIFYNNNISYIIMHISLQLGSFIVQIQKILLHM